MNKALLYLSLVTASASAGANEIYNGRVSAMAGAGYATAGYADGALYNPSLLANFAESDDGALVLNLGAITQDPNDTLDNLDALVDLTDQLSGSSILNLADAHELKRLLHLVDDKTLHAHGSASLVVAIPNNTLSAALVAKGTFSVAATADISTQDFDTIDSFLCAANDPSNCPVFNPEQNLDSSVNARGVVIQEIGLALAKSFDLDHNSRLLIGLTPKRVEVDTIVYRAEIANFDKDDIDNDEYRTNGSSTSMDAGITFIEGNLSYALTVNNIASKTFQDGHGNRYELATRSTAALGYQTHGFRAEAAIDLNTTEVFSLTDKTRMLRIGTEFSPLSWLQIRTGYQKDLESTLPNAFTAGIGISPGDTVNIDLAALKGSDSTIGGALQLGIRF